MKWKKQKEKFSGKLWNKQQNGDSREKDQEERRKSWRNRKKLHTSYEWM